MDDEILECITKKHGDFFSRMKNMDDEKIECIKKHGDFFSGTKNMEDEKIECIKKHGDFFSGI